MPLIWPTNLETGQEGYAIGWRSEKITCVLAIVEDWRVVEALSPRQSSRDTKIAPGDARHIVLIGHLRNGVQNRSGAVNANDTELVVRDGKLLECRPPMKIIQVDPPDQDRLRYLSSSELLQERMKPKLLKKELEILDDYGPNVEGEEEVDEVNEMLSMINSIRGTQRYIELITSTHNRKTLRVRAYMAATIPFLTFALLPISALLHLIIRISEHSIPLIGLGDFSLASRSATLTQLTLRSRQLLLAPAAFRKTVHVPGVSVQIRSRRYMRFWNTVWLILNDLILGYCAYQLLAHNDRFLVHIIPQFIKRYLADNIITALNWLNDWPVGLKLNTPLSQFYASTLGSIIQSWKDTICPAIEQLAPSLITIFAITSLGGLTFFLAALEDLTALITLHLILCDTMTRGIYRWQLASLGGLWNLFRGKRWNELRQRTDSYQYDVDQLFLGTLLFTVSAFLFPTVLTYAALFYTISLLTRSLSYILRTFRIALNSFPLFELLLRIKEPSRLPAGIHFVLRPKGKDGALPYLELKNSPRSLGSILGGILRPGKSLNQ